MGRTPVIRRLLPPTPALPAPARALFALVAAGALLYAVLLGAQATAAHDGLAPALYAGIAALVVRRAAAVREDRAAWSLLAAGLLAYGAGSLIYAAATGDDGRVPWAAHAAWLAFYPLAYAAVLLLVRTRVPSLAFSLALDGILAALTAAALATLWLPGLDGSPHDDVDAASGLAYLAGDVLLVAVLLWSATLGGRAGKRLWLTLAAGAALVCAGDLSAAVTDLGAVSDRLTRAAYPVGMLLLALAAWQPPGRRRYVRADSLSAIGPPSVCTAALLAVLGTEAFTGEVPRTTHVIALLALCVAAVRAVVSYRQLSRFREGRRYQRGFQDAAIGMALIDAGDLRWLRVNTTLCRMLGRTEAELVGRPIAEVIAPEDPIDPQRVVADRAGGKHIPAFARTFVHADGHTRVEAQVTSVLVDEQEDQPYFFSQVRDLTLRNRATRRSGALAELGRLALDRRDREELLPEALAVAAAAIGAEGCTLDRGPSSMAPALAGSASVALLGRAERLVARRAGGPFDAEDVRFLQAAADILAGALERADAEAELRRRALEDPLTGLANRAFLTGHLEHELAATARGEGPLALLLLDVDRFKTINDTLGHNAGDELLRQVAARLVERLRQGDVVARLGGDEFVVACGRLQSAGEAAGLAQRVVDAFAAPFALDGRELHLSTSVGVAVADDAGATPGALLRDADTAMYRAKEHGGGRFELFDAELRARVVQRLTLEHALRGAVDRGELAVELQPIVRLDGEILLGFEALVRWHHPELGRVAPCDFIPIAEDTDLIRPIGRWVIEQALRATVRMNARPASAQRMRIGVNLSPRELVPDLVPFVRDTARRVGADLPDLVIEITERLLVEGDGPRSVVQQLRDLGVGTALDDFGTGYSSLAAVDEYPLDFVKLDRSLAANLGSTARAEGLVRGAVGMTTALGARVLAEGLEDERQVRAARALGCFLGQGWYWAPSLPLDAAEALVASHAGRRLPPAAARRRALSPAPSPAPAPPAG